MSFKNIVKETISMQEKRVSTLILSLIASLILAFYMFLFVGDIPQTLLTIIQTLIYIVGGVNGLNVLTKVFKGNTDSYNEGE